MRAHAIAAHVTALGGHAAAPEPLNALYPGGYHVLGSYDFEWAGRPGRRRHLDPGARVRRFLERLAGSVDHQTLLDECLDAVVQLLDADRGFVLVMDGEDQPFAVNARGHGRALSPPERLEVSTKL